MPDFSEFRRQLGDDFDPDNSAGRSNRWLAIAVVVPEYDWETYGTGSDAEMTLRLGKTIRRKR